MIDAAGFTEIRWLLLAGGIIAIHSATKRQMTAVRSVPPPVTAVMDAASAWLPGAHVRGRGPARRALRGLRRRARRGGRGHSDRRRQAPAPALVLMAAGERERGTGPCAPPPPWSWSIWRPWSTTTCSTARRCGAAARRWSRAGQRPRGRGGRPALLARLRRARRRRAASGEVGRAQLGLGRAGPRRAGPAPRRLRHLDHRGALPGSLLPEDRPPLRVRLPGRAASPREARHRGLASFGREIGLAFQLLDDVLDVTGPPERTGKARGTDLLDGTVTLPLILARRLDPEPRVRRAARPRPGAAERLCDRIAATGALEEVRDRAAAGSSAAKASRLRTILRRGARALGTDRRRSRRTLLLRTSTTGRRRGRLCLQGGDSSSGTVCGDSR